MAFNNPPRVRAWARRAKAEHVFCVGWHAFVHWPHRAGQPLGPVPLWDATGQALANDLADGQEVEIVSWRPRACEGATYQVRRVTDGTEWWIAATYLRRQRYAGAGNTDGVVVVAR
jgi:hypothetical protein